MAHAAAYPPPLLVRLAPVWREVGARLGHRPELLDLISSKSQGDTMHAATLVWERVSAQGQIARARLLATLESVESGAPPPYSAAS